MDDLPQQIEANLIQVEANHEVIDTNLRLINSARWRVIRNRQLLDRCWELIREDTRLLSENNLLLARRQQRIDGHRA